MNQHAYRSFPGKIKQNELRAAALKKQGGIR
jgi:hypothetical protein